MPMPACVLRAREQPARLSSFTLCRPAAYPRAKSSIVPFIFKEMTPGWPRVSHRIHHRITTLNAARPRPMSCLAHKGHTKYLKQMAPPKMPLAMARPQWRHTPFNILTPCSTFGRILPVQESALCAYGSLRVN